MWYVVCLLYNMLTIILMIMAGVGLVNELLTKKRHRVVLRFEANEKGFAYIDLELFSDGNFILFIKPENKKIMSYRGVWLKEEDELHLKFEENSPDVHRIFTYPSVHFDGHHKISFKSDCSSIRVYGLACKRKQQSIQV